MELSLYGLVNSDSRDAFLHQKQVEGDKDFIKFQPEAGWDFANENSTFGRIVESQRELLQILEDGSERK